jgi:hypothetical protein
MVASDMTDPNLPLCLRVSVVDFVLDV